MVRKRIRKVFSPKIVAALLAAVISISNVQGVNAVVNDNVDSTSTEGSASEDEMLDGETAWVNGKLVTGNIGTLNPDPAHSDLTDGKIGDPGVPSSGFNYEISSVGKDGQTIMIPKHMYTGKDDGKTFNIYIPSIKDLIAGSDPTDTYMQEKTVTMSSETDRVIEPDSDKVGMTKVTINDESQFVKDNVRKGKKIFGMEGGIEDLSTVSNREATDVEKAGAFDYKVSSISAKGQTITIPKAKYTGNDDFKIYIPSVLDLSDPDTSSTFIPLQSKPVTLSASSQTIKADNGYVGLKEVTVPGIPGTAQDNQILSGKTAWVNGTKITGSMANNGALNKSDLAAGDSFTIPAGYTSGGTVTAKSLASQTSSATAVAGDILSGKTAYVNGSLITGTMTNQGAISGTISPGSSKSFSAGYYSAGTVRASACTSTHVNNRDGGTITPGTSNQTITPGSGYTGLSQVVVAGDSDLIADNIKQGVTIFGVTGSLNSSSSDNVPGIGQYYIRAYSEGTGKISASVAIDITNVNTISFTPDKNSKASYSNYEIYKGFLGNVTAPFGVKVRSGNYSSGTNTIDVSDLSGVHTFVIQGSSKNGGSGIIVVDLKCS